MVKECILFKEDFQLSRELFFEAGKVLAQHHFANATYWTREQVMRDYPEIRAYLGQEFYVMLVNSIPAGAVILQRKDEDLWAEADGKALYISKMCIVHPFRGKNYSKRFFEFCLEKSRAYGCRYIRFDTCSASRAHCTYYKKCGFKEIDCREVEGDTYSLFEMDLSEISSRAED